MGTQTNRFAAFILCSSTLWFAGCKSNPPAPATPAQTTTAPVAAPAQQTTPAPIAIRNPDGSITNPDGSVTYPAGSRVATKENNPAPVAPPPLERPAIPAGGTNNNGASLGTAAVERPVERVALTVAAGTPVVVRINSGLAASRNEVGDRFTGTLQQALTSHGTTVFAAGTAVSGEVVASKKRGKFKGAGDLGIQLTQIGRDRVATSEYEQVSKGKGKRSAVFTGGGAGLGALIGGLAGGGKGALIGGLAGAGGGAAAGAYTGNKDVTIPAESIIRFRLTEAITR